MFTLTFSGFSRAKIVATTLLILAGSITTAQATVTQTCRIVPTADKPSPLAMRANFTMEEQDGTIVTVKYNPSPTIFDRAQPAVMAGSLQSLQFFETNVAAVRARMLKEPKYFKFLTSFPEGDFKAFNDALVCDGKTPVAQITTNAIDSLPDGDYRFWNGAAANNVSDQQILAKGEGGGVFLFRKTGTKIVGQYARPNEVAFCIAGTISNGKVMGTASPVDRAAPGGRPGDNSKYDPVGYLTFGMWKGGEKTGFSEGSTLDLTQFNPINVGTRKVIAVCR